MNGTKYPLLFTYHDILAGNGFIAGIRIRGRSLMVEEEDGDVWIYGVNPGGISNGGKSRKEAASAFRSVYQAVLYDIAEEAQTFAELKDGVESFCAETNAPNAQEWRKAVKLGEEIRYLQLRQEDTPPTLALQQNRHFPSNGQSGIHSKTTKTQNHKGTLSISRDFMISWLDFLLPSLSGTSFATLS